MAFCVIIPARHDSTRLPGKPLRKLGNKPMIQHVHENASRSLAGQVIIATDDERIQQAAEGFGARVCMTASTHRSGTERLAEVIDSLSIDDDTIVVNLQGDEPLMPLECLDQVAAALADNPSASVATLCTPVTDSREIFDPNVVKVVRDRHEFALYFSRAPIPWHREHFPQAEMHNLDTRLYQRHIGLYAYRARYIKEYIASPPSPLEAIESLEQLRVLWNGQRIIVPQAKMIPGPGVDTEEDLKAVARLLVQSGL